MGKRIGSRAIIIKDEKVLTMYRRKVDKEGNIDEYYVMPGGGQEGNETLEETVIRELKEEFNVDIKILRYLGTQENEKSINHFYQCEITNGMPKLSGEELERMTDSNYYEIREIPLVEINNINLIGKEMVKLAINKTFEEQE